MSSDLADTHDELRAVARNLLSADRQGAGAADRQGAGADWRRFAELGWLGLEVPEALNGVEATFAEVAIVLEELGRAAAATPYLGSTVLGVGTLLALAPGTGRDGLLLAASSGATLPVAALVDGADDGLTGRVPFALERSPAGLVLGGLAAFVPDAAAADRLLLLALDPAGTPVVVDLDPHTAGLVVTAQPVLDATRQFGLVSADGVRLGEDAVWRFAADPQLAVRRLLDRAATALACDSLGLSEAMLAATVAYASERTQFGRPIGSFQAVKHACADLLVQISVSRRLVADAVLRLASGDREASVAVSMAKAYTCAVAVGIAGKAMQLHGGMGYTWEGGIHVYLKRAALSRTLFGSPAAHRRRLAARYR